MKYLVVAFVAFILGHFDGEILVWLRNQVRKLRQK